MPKLALVTGLVFATMIASAIGLVGSLLAWQSKGMVEWGMLLMLGGVLFKVLFDRL